MTTMSRFILSYSQCMYALEQRFTIFLHSLVYTG